MTVAYEVQRPIDSVSTVETVVNRSKHVGGASLTASEILSPHEVELKKNNDEELYGQLGLALADTIDAQQSDVSDAVVLECISKVTQFAKEAATKTLPDSVVNALVDTPVQFNDDVDTEKILRPLVDEVEENDRSRESVTPDKVRLLGMAWDESGCDPELEGPLVLMATVLKESEEFSLEGQAATKAISLVKQRADTGLVVETNESDRPGFNAYYETTHNALIDTLTEEEATEAQRRTYLQDSLSVLNRVEHDVHAKPSERHMTAGIVVQDAHNVISKMMQDEDPAAHLANPARDATLGVMLIEAMIAARTYDIETDETASLKCIREIATSLYEQSIPTLNSQQRKEARELEVIVNAYKNSNGRLDLRKALQWSMLSMKNDFHS